MSTQTEIEALAGFVSSLRFEQLSDRSVGLAKLAMLNILGGIIASTHPTLNPGRASLLRYAERWGAAPRATILGTNLRTAPELAALVTSGSAMMAHGDDWSWPGKSHFSSVIFPAALATAEAGGRSGRALITAFVAGWEVAARVGAAILPTERKIPFTSPVHSLGTASVAASLDGLDIGATARALSVACDMGTGLISQAPSQHVVLRTPLGSALGLYAAGIAREGVSGRFDILETFCRVYGDYDRAAVLDGLGRRSLFEETGFLPKVFHLSTGTYPTLYGLQRRQQQNQIATRDIVAIECATSPAICTVYGAPPAASREMTHFSLALGMALALTGAPFLYETVATVPNPDPEATRLAHLVKLVRAPHLAAQVNLGAEAEESRTTITLRDGRVEVVDSVPYPAVLDPAADRTRVEELFLRRVTARWDAGRAKQIADTVLRLDTVDRLDDLIALLRGPGTAR